MRTPIDYKSALRRAEYVTASVEVPARRFYATRRMPSGVITSREERHNELRRAPQPSWRSCLHESVEAGHVSATRAAALMGAERLAAPCRARCRFMRSMSRARGHAACARRRAPPRHITHIYAALADMF